MHKPAILALFAAVAAAQAQTVAAGARAVVSSDTLPVYAAMSDTAEVKATLVKGDTVIIGLVLFGSDITWCAISKVDQTRRLGFASCEFLDPDRGTAAPAAPAPKPDPPKPPPPAPAKPIAVREILQAPIVAPEIPSSGTIAAPPPAPKPAPKQDPPKPPPVAPSKPITIREIPQAPIVVREIPSSGTIAAPPPAPEPAPKQDPPKPPPVAPSKPITIREIPQAPIVVREIPSSTPIAAPPASAPPPVVQNDFIEILLDDSGLRSSLANYTGRTNLISFLDKSRLAELELPTLERAISKRFQPGAFYAAIGGQVRKHYSPENLPAVVEWLRSPATTRLASLERRSFAPGAREELVAFAGGLGAAPPPQSRLVLIHRLYDSLRTCDMEVEATIALVHTVAQAIGPVLPKEKRYGAVELDRALGAVKSKYRSIMKNARIVHYLFAYQQATDEELDQYVNFLESGAGKWMISLVDKGFYDATEAISRGLRADIPRNVKPKRRLPGENTAKGLLP